MFLSLCLARDLCGPAKTEVTAGFSSGGLWSLRETSHPYLTRHKSSPVGPRCPSPHVPVSAEGQTRHTPPPPP